MSKWGAGQDYEWPFPFLLNTLLIGAGSQRCRAVLGIALQVREAERLLRSPSLAVREAVRSWESRVWQRGKATYIKAVLVDR